MDYKNTLNIPTTEFEMKANLSSKEPKIQQQWIQNKIYKKVLEKNKNKNGFLLHDGPPYANGNIHIGHALNKTLKDIIVRQKNLAGFYAPYNPGWDTHGLPIEVAMLKKYGANSNMSVSERRQACYNYALEQINIQKAQFLRIGMLSDFETIYRTLDHEFEINQLELFLTCVKKNIIFRDKKPVYWSWSSQSALAEAEIEYKDVEDTSIYIKFDVVNNPNLPENTSLLVWTTTPWTIPANLAISVNPKLKYVLFNYKNNNYIAVKSLIETLTNKFNWESKDIKIIKTINSSLFETIEYKHPFIQRTGKILFANYVSDVEGTGLVHTAPGFGVDDYIVSKANNIEVYSPIDNYGKYDSTINDKELEGVFYNDANKIIIQKLKNTNNLVKQENIVHRVACDWRTKKPVIYRATEQWFININKISNKIITSLKNDVKSPFQKNTERMIEMINNRSEWCISRQRVWGVPIPIIFESSTNEPILDIELIQNIINVLNTNSVNVWFEWPVEKFLTDKYLKSGKKYHKEQDIMDVWFDSGTSHQLFKQWGLSYPADIYLEGSDQYRGWFNSSLITGVIQNDKAPYKAILQHGFTLDENGIKMSKSIGNVIDPLKIFDQYGADIFRLWVASCEYTDDQRFGENIIKQIAEIYRKIRNTLFKYSLSLLNDFKKLDIQTELSIEDKYILERLRLTLMEIDEAYKNYQFNNVVKLMNNFTIELSSWYFDLIKDEMYCGNLDSLRRKQIQTVIYKILLNSLIALAPILPHTTDEAYNFLPFKNYESVHLEDWLEISNYKLLDQDNIDNFEKFFKLKDQVYNLIEIERKNGLIKKTNMVDLTLKNNPTNIEPKILKQYLNIANVSIDSNIDNDIKIKIIDFSKCERCWNYYNSENMHSDDLCIRCNKVINK